MKWNSLIFCLVFFSFSPIASAEVIKSFNSQIVVNPESSISVTETIVYDSEGLVKHGIFRDIKPVSSEGKPMMIKDISVSNIDGTSMRWQREYSNGDVRLKIGDPDVTFTGLKTYVINYTATNAVAHLQNGKDEIYWNVTGNAWPFNIEVVAAGVVLPSGINEQQNACYIGIIGSTERCVVGNVDDGFYSNRSLMPGEGMTVAVGFPVGFVHDHVPTIKEKVIDFLKKFWPLLIPLSTFIFMFSRWYQRGRDPKDSNIVVPQYDVPDSLTPLEVGIIVYEKSRTKDISAELIYLATKGYIKIRQIDEKVLGFIDVKKYELIHLQEQSTLANDFDRKLLNKIFENVPVGKSVELSSLQRKFYKNIPSIFQSIRQAMLTKQYYKNLPKTRSSSLLWTFLTSVIPIIYIAGILWTSFYSRPIDVSSIDVWSESFLLLMLSLIVSFITFVIFQKLMPAKTEKGVATKDYILGLKQYLQIAEKDRLNFHNAPEKKPEVFEQLLAYAMVLGVEKAWAKEFKDIYTTPPSWYEGSNSAFNAVLFTNSLSNFSTFASSTLSSAPHSSGGGSGGGGSSGGGGGGGGGGSW